MGDNVETSRSCKRQRVCEEQVEDRISSLPDSILIHILSFLPIQDAVRTDLVPRFRHLWKFLTSLTFDFSFLGNFFNFFHHVLILHENATTDKFVVKLCIDFEQGRTVSEVDWWVYFAMRKKVKVLDLHMEGLERYKLPSFVFRGNYLVELKLFGCEIKPSGQIQWNCLKRLFLESTFLNDDTLNQILGGCSVLEELSLHCRGLGRLGFRNSSIKSLKVFHYPTPYQETWLEINCPNIESLDIAGRLDFVDLVDVSSVVVSSTSFRGFQYSRKRYRRRFKTLFKNLGHCKTFRTCDSCIQIFSTWQLRKQAGLLFGWKHLELEVGLTKWHLPGISCLLRTSPNLETLAMFFGPVDLNAFTLGDDYKWMERHDFDEGNFWRSQEGTFHCLKYHLKTIKMNGQITGPYVMDIIKFLLKNAKVLEKFEISTQNTFKRYSRQKVALTKRRRLEFSLKLLNLPRASSSVVIVLS